jgi:UDP-glucuronate decarboxylase
MHPNDGRDVSNFIMQALAGEPITIYGDGQQTRSFCYVDDLIEAFIRLMKTPEDIIGPINLGNPVEFTIQELGEKVIELANSKSEINFEPLPEDDPAQRKPDINQAKTSLEWEPKVSLEDGLKKTFDYFSRVLNPPWANQNFKLC